MSLPYAWVHVSDALPLIPSDGENARRMVRHGLADVLAYIGEKPGLRPYEQTHALWAAGILMVSPQHYVLLKVFGEEH